MNEDTNSISMVDLDAQEVYSKISTIKRRDSRRWPTKQALETWGYRLINSKSFDLHKGDCN